MFCKPAIASHRGGAYLWPENSLLAFRESLRLPVEQLELDVHASADGEPVIMHDATLDRMTDLAGPVVARSLAKLRAGRVRGTHCEAIPMLADVLPLLAATTQGLRLEVKCGVDGRPYPGFVQRCAEVLDEAGLRARTLLMSFQPLDVAQAASLGGFAGIVLLLEARAWRGMGLAGAVALARGCSASEIGLPLAEFDHATVQGCRRHGLATSAWGVNGHEGVERAMDLGLDAMTTDDPVTALALRGCRY